MEKTWLKLEMMVQAPFSALQLKKVENKQGTPSTRTSDSDIVNVEPSLEYLKAWWYPTYSNNPSVHRIWAPSSARFVARNLVLGWHGQADKLPNPHTTHWVAHGTDPASLPDLMITAKHSDACDFKSVSRSWHVCVWSDEHIIVYLAVGLANANPSSCLLARSVSSPTPFWMQLKHCCHASRQEHDSLPCFKRHAEKIHIRSQDTTWHDITQQKCPHFGISAFRLQPLDQHIMKWQPTLGSYPGMALDLSAIHKCWRAKSRDPMLLALLTWWQVVRSFCLLPIKHPPIHILHVLRLLTTTISFALATSSNTCNPSDWKSQYQPVEDPNSTNKNQAPFPQKH